MTESIVKTVEWNAVNPISEKPKFGRGTSKTELKVDEDSNVDR